MTTARTTKTKKNLINKQTARQTNKQKETTRIKTTNSI